MIMLTILAGLESRSDSVCRDFSFQDFHIIYRKTFIHIRIDHTAGKCIDLDVTRC